MGWLLMRSHCSVFIIYQFIQRKISSRVLCFFSPVFFGQNLEIISGLGRENLCVFKLIISPILQNQILCITPELVRTNHEKQRIIDFNHEFEIFWSLRKPEFYKFANKIAGFKIYQKNSISASGVALSPLRL